MANLAGRCPCPQKLNKDDIEKSGDHGRGTGLRVLSFTEDEPAAQLQPFKWPVPQSAKNDYWRKNGKESFRKRAVEPELAAKPACFTAPSWSLDRSN